MNRCLSIPEQMLIENKCKSLLQCLTMLAKRELKINSGLAHPKGKVKRGQSPTLYQYIAKPDQLISLTVSKHFLLFHSTLNQNLNENNFDIVFVVCT